MSGSQQNLDQLAKQLFDALEKSGDVLVLAESCTAGLISATLGRVPGMSRRLAGSFVVYQIDSKVAWLDMPNEMIQQHGVVSPDVAVSMATRALHLTPHATIAMSITGHLGPDAPQELDGVAWLGIAAKNRHPFAVQLYLDSETIEDPIQLRHHRQEVGVQQALDRLLSELETCQPLDSLERGDSHHGRTGRSTGECLKESGS